MNNKYFTRVLPMAILALCVAFTGFTGCAGGDMATVTVSVKHPDLARTYTPSFFDRMIAFFSLGTRAEAGPPTGGLTFERMRLFVSGPDIAPINTQIPMNEGKITVSVPSGKNILFRVKADGSGTTYDYAGQVVTDLAPGESRLLAIPMRAAIHIGGRESTSACYWQNGARVNLPGTSGEATAITVYNDTVYCAGMYNAGNTVACYWVSTSRYDLMDGVANSIAVTPENIYVGGARGSQGGYWVNNDAGFVQLSQGVGEIKDISLAGGNVFAAGVDEEPLLAYWVNGTRTVLESGSNRTLTGIYVSGGNVYISGYSTSPQRAFYYKNNTKYNLETSIDSFARDIVVVGDDVYVAGYYTIGSDNFACYWRNGVRVDMTHPIVEGNDTFARAIAIKDGDIYMAGNFSNDMIPINTACFWKNGTLYSLNEDNTYATSLFVY